ncbi:MAG: acyl carrier protein [Chloroflexota bacterium]
MSIREIIQEKLAAVVTENSPVDFPNDIDDEDRLEDFWLDSVAFAKLLTQIEEEVGYIPTQILEGDLYPETFGELVGAYE